MVLSLRLGESKGRKDKEGGEHGGAAVSNHDKSLVNYDFAWTAITRA